MLETMNWAHPSELLLTLPVCIVYIPGCPVVRHSRDPLFFHANSGAEPNNDTSVGSPTYKPLILFSPGLFITSERDTMDQRIAPIDEVIATVTDLVFGTIDWAEACRRLPAYDGVQAID